MDRQPTGSATDGRATVSRADMAQIANVTLATLNRWYAERAVNGHPEPVPSHGRRLLFDERQWRDWHRGFLAAKKATLTTVDRAGDPNELIGASEFARVLGYNGTDPGASIRAYLRKNPGYLPPPDQQDPLPSGRIRRLWTRRTAWAFADSRDKRGGARPATDTHPPHYSTHPQLNDVRTALTEPAPPNAAELARRLGIKTHTARRLINAAKNQ